MTIGIVVLDPQKQLQQAETRGDTLQDDHAVQKLKDLLAR